MPPKQDKQPKWLIDTHGMREAFRTTKNSVRVAVIDAIESGEMLILKDVSKEMKDLYPEHYDDFKAIKNKKYLTVSLEMNATATVLMETSGANIVGSVPPVERFEALAASRKKKCSLVTSGKAYKDCCTIAAKNGLPATAVIDVLRFA